MLYLFLCVSISRCFDTHYTILILSEKRKHDNRRVFSLYILAAFAIFLSSELKKEPCALARRHLSDEPVHLVICLIASTMDRTPIP
jgi:hypothetical protein